MRHLLTIALIGLTGLVLAGCGSGSGRSADTDYSHLREPASTQGALTDQHPPSDFSQYLRNGLRMRVRTGSHYVDGEVAMPNESADDAASGDDFSGTNVHVEGVDEADRLKYDGHHLFVAESPYYSYAHFAASVDLESNPATDAEPPKGQALRILSTSPDSVGATEMARYVFERSESSSLVLSELYTLESEAGQTSTVAALSDTHLHFDPWRWGAMPLATTGKVSTRVDLLNVESPANPQLTWSIELEGSLENSRKIGDILYLVTRFTPTIDGLEPYASTVEQRRRNEDLISHASMDELLPRYTMDDGAKLPLVREEHCFLPKEITPDEGYAELVTISAIDLRHREVVSSACINARLSGLYMSLEGLYLGTSITSTSVNSSDADIATDDIADTSWDGPGTALHKFAIESGDIEYRGSGAVPGALNWSDPSFSMDEQAGYLRVVTSDRRGWNDFEHYLHVLREADAGSGDELELVARLPNEDQPEPIGKPGEDIFAVRFLGNKAYVVTFERTDPLYVIDLTDNERPFIAGALEIPGVSTYLHPVADGYLVSVGEETTELGRATGVKVELFDVRDDTEPRSIATDIIGGQGSWSEALRDLRAFNFMPVGEDQFRFSLPVTRRNGYEWQDSGLHLYEINDLTADEATLHAAGSLIVERNDNGEGNYPHASGNARSRLHGDTVYYLHGNAIWASRWGDPENIQGPF